MCPLVYKFFDDGSFSLFLFGLVPLRTSDSATNIVYVALISFYASYFHEQSYST